jgi:hypothetical protein
MNFLLEKHAKIFEKPTGNDSIPPHRPFDLEITLVKDAKIPFRPVIPLSSMESLWLKEY